jgi:hypothetical protein
MMTILVLCFFGTLSFGTHKTLEKSKNKMNLITNLLL